MSAAGRVGDKSRVPSDVHGCPACPHVAVGPAVSGSPTVFIDGRSALRLSDTGIHAACCGPNTWIAVQGSASVFINGFPAHRKGDADLHCGGMGKLIEGSGTVDIGGGATSLTAAVIAATLAQLTTVGDPVDVATGRVFVVAADFSFRGALLLPLVRTWSSDRAGARGLFGQGWSCLLDLHLRRSSGGALCYHDAEGRTIPIPERSGVVSCLPSEGLWVIHEHDAIRLVDRRGVARLFSDRGGDCWVLTRLERGDAAIRLEHQGSMLERITDSAGLEYGFERDAHGRLASIRLRSSDRRETIVVQSYRFDEHDRLVETEDALGQVARYGYDVSDRIVRKTLRNGYDVFFEYDAEGRCTRTVAGDGKLERCLRYHPASRETEVADSRGNITRYRWNSENLVVQKTNPLGNIERTYFDSSRNKVKSIDANGNETRYQYDQHGDLRVLVDPEGRAWNAWVDAEAVQLQDDAGGYVRRTFDESGRLVRVEDAAGNALALSLEESFPGGTDANLAPRVVEPPGRSRSDTDRPDRWGLLATRTDPMGQETHFSYDLKGRLIARKHPNGGWWRYEYDAEDNLSRVMDSCGGQRTFRHEGFGYQMQAGDAEPGEIRYEYDREGMLNVVTNERGERVRFSIDSVNRLSEEVGFDGRSRSYQYDAGGRVTSIRDTTEARVELALDRSGRVVEVRGRLDGGGETTLAYHYDRAGRLIAAEDELGVVRLRHDGLGRIIREERGADFVETTYGDTGRPVLLTSSTGARLGISLDGSGRVAAVEMAGKRSIRLTRNVAGRPTERLLPDGSRSVCTYDVMGRHQSLEVRRGGHAVVRRECRYDQAGRVALVRDLLRGEFRYAYDRRSRLVGFTRSGAVPLRYVYDRTGNTLQAGTILGSYGTGNRLRQWGDARYEFDARGNQIARTNALGVTRYTYNALNQLVGVVDPSGRVTTMSYDALGRRILKQSPAGRTGYLWNQFSLLAERGDQGTTEFVFYPRHLVPLARIEEGRNFYYYHTDHLGTPWELVDEDGAFVWQGNLDPWGRCVERGRLQSSLRFQGQIHDPETDLHYNGFRYYDPTTGRYLSQDPLGYQSGDFNLYRYAGNDPVNRTDPLGLFPIVGFGAYELGALAFSAVAAGGTTYVASQSQSSSYSFPSIGNPFSDIFSKPQVSHSESEDIHGGDTKEEAQERIDDVLRDAMPGSDEVNKHKPGGQGEADSDFERIVGPNRIERPPGQPPHARLPDGAP